MIDINLYPWRSEHRKKQKNFFLTALIGLVVATLVVIMIIHFMLRNTLVHQTQRNQILQIEIQHTQKALTDQKAAEQNLATGTTKLRSIEKLHNNRYILVHFLNNIHKIMPKNIRLDRIQFTCQGTELVGVAPSDQAISQFMKNIAKSDFLEKPSLNEVKVKKGSTTEKDFGLKAALKDKSC